jgi:aryl-alcohol dehydrogenase-like predicted oxidoreductase
MEKRQIGKSGLWVNPIGFGANAVGGHNIYGPLDESAGKAVMRAAIEAGVDFIDTAFIYGPERSEVLVGEVIREMGVRNQVVLATKDAYRFTDDGVVFDNSPDFLRECVDACLRRLQTDYIDLFYIHQPDENTPKDQAVAALQELKAEGKIRAIGVSNFSLAQLEEANRNGGVDAVQNQYSLLVRDAEKDVLSYAAREGITFVPYFPLASGLLAGKYRPETRFADHRADNPLFQGEAFQRNLEKVEQLRPIARAHGAEVGHIALAWCLSRNGIDAIIPGAKDKAQLQSNLKAGQVQLSEAEINRIDRLFAPE